MGAGQRAPEGVIRYRLGDAVAARRARAAAAVAAATSLVPILFAMVLLNKVGWHPHGAVSTAAAALATLVIVRAIVACRASRRRLRAIVVTASADDVRVETSRDAYTLERARVARIIDIEGTLGGLRVESAPDPNNGAVCVVHVPRGGEAFADLRAHLEGWRPLERRRRGPMIRLAAGAVVVAGIFFAPFLLDDFVARSRLVAGGLVVGVWLLMRTIAKRV